LDNIKYKIRLKENYDLIIIGNMTKDYINDNSDFQLGGPSLYAGIAASKLGLQTLMISNHTISKNYFDNFPLLDVLNISNHADTEFLINYKNNQRNLILKNKASKITLNLNNKIKTKMLMLAPVLDDFELSIKKYFDYDLSSLCVQGYLRKNIKQGIIEFIEEKYCLNYQGINIINCSSEEISKLCNENLFSNFVEYISVTYGSDGSTLIDKYNNVNKYKNYNPKSLIDPTGAGDVFALYMLVFYYRTNNINYAVEIANCAASYVVEGLGIASIPDLNSVEKRLNEQI
tara:strand:- start:4196 stop:5059 length:864 start_codon:yes stop_codon:yes gene_type:complete